MYPQIQKLFFMKNFSAPPIHITAAVIAALLFFNTNIFSQNTFPPSGNVGIGTTTPTEELEVIGTIKVEELKLGSNTLQFSSNGLSRTDGDLRLQTADTVIRGTDTTYIDPSNFNTIINVQNAGKVGIGTFSPSEKLTVEGTIYSTTGGFKFPDNTIQTTAGVQQNSNASFSSLAVSNLAGTGDRLLSVDSSGNLKVNPLTSVDAWDTDGNAITNGDFLGTTNSNDLVIKTNNQERMQITATGNIGIGTSNPQKRLHIWQTDDINNPSCATSIRLEYDVPAVVNGCGATAHSIWDLNARGMRTETTYLLLPHLYNSSR